MGWTLQFSSKQIMKTPKNTNKKIAQTLATIFARLEREILLVGKKQVKKRLKIKEISRFIGILD